MIPKIIHYCWLSGDEYPQLTKACIESWRKVLPEYEFILWDYNSIRDIQSDWLIEAYQNKKYAFAADYVRFYALYHYGGIYLDADVEVLKSYNSLLSGSYFIGEEVTGYVEAATIASEPKADWIRDCLSYYEERHFIREDGTLDMKPCPVIVSNILKNYPTIEIKPYYYFSPKDMNTGKIEITDDTFSIHHFDGKWLPITKTVIIKRKIHTFLKKILGYNLYKKLITIIHSIKEKF